MAGNISLVFSCLKNIYSIKNQENINENLLTALCPQIAVELFGKIQKAHEGKFLSKMLNTLLCVIVPTQWVSKMCYRACLN